jgi:hypothetical protein
VDRRLANSADIYAFLSCYFPDVFWRDWTDQRREMVGAILNAARYGGDPAIAAPRPIALEQEATERTESSENLCSLFQYVQILAWPCFPQDRFTHGLHQSDSSGLVVPRGGCLVEIARHGMMLARLLNG